MRVELVVVSGVVRGLVVTRRMPTGRGIGGAGRVVVLVVSVWLWRWLLWL